MINDLELKSLKRISDFDWTDFFLIDDQFYTLTMFNVIFLNYQWRIKKIEIPFVTFK